MKKHPVSTLLYLIPLLGAVSHAEAVTVRMTPYAQSGIWQPWGTSMTGFSYTMIAEFGSAGVPTGTDALRFHATSVEVIVDGVRSFLGPSELALTSIVVQDLPTSLGIYFEFAIPAATGSSFVRSYYTADWEELPGPEVNKPDVGAPGAEDLVWLSNSVLTSPEFSNNIRFPILYDGSNRDYLGSLSEFGLGEVTVVPEPSAVLLALPGIALLMRRRR